MRFCAGMHGNRKSSENTGVLDDSELNGAKLGADLGKNHRRGSMGCMGIPWTKELAGTSQIDEQLVRGWKLVSMNYTKENEAKE